MKLAARGFLPLLLPALLCAADPATLQKISGTVELKPSQGAAWGQAKAGTTIPSGGQVRTGTDGRAELKFQNKASVWMKPATSVSLDQKGAKHNQIVLGGGSLKIRVPHLKFREKFEVKTPLAVASVRGTVFSIDEGKVQTFFGHVNMHMPDGKKVSVPQGGGFDGNKISILSQMDQALGLEDWSPGLSDQERQQGLAAFVENRQLARDLAHDALARNSELVDALAADVKSADFAAGRTLTDVHGNLVRVEQRLERPDAHTVQVTNIVLRQSYSSGGLRRYSYHGSNASRVDALISKVEFNKGLPEQINSFPGFFASEGDSVKVDRVSMVAANLEDPTQIATIAFLGERNSNAGTDDIKSDLYVGSVNGRPTLFNLSASNALSSGLSRYKDANAAMDNVKGVGGELYSATARKFGLDQQGSGSAPSDAIVWVCAENFVINNSGGVRNVSDYTSGGNVLDLLGNSAAQSAVFVKKNSGGSFDNSSTGDVLPGGRNIDVVVIPDLFLSVVKSLATSADAFKTTY